MIRAKIAYKNKDDIGQKTAAFYELSTVKDITGKEYTLYMRGKLKRYVDIIINNPQIGIIFNGYFVLAGKYEDFSCRKAKLIENFSKININDYCKGSL